MAQFEEIKKNVHNWDNDDEVASFLRRILKKEVCDHTGLIYGMGHAIYTLSDPRAVVLKQNAGRWRKRPAIWRNFSFWRLSSV